MRAPNATLGVSTPRLGGNASRSSTMREAALSHAQMTVHADSPDRRRLRIRTPRGRAVGILSLAR